MLINFADFSFTSCKKEFLKISVQKIWSKGTVIEIAVQWIFYVNLNFPWKRPILSMNYFERVFQEFWSQIKKQILRRTYVLQNNHFWTKLPLAACVTFLFSKFVCIWLLILHERIQFFKESQVVAKESFSTELMKTIVHKSFKKRCFRNIGRTYKKTLTAKYN